MDFYSSLRRQIRAYIFGFLFVTGLVTVAAWFGLNHFHASPIVTATILAVSVIVLAVGGSFWLTVIITEPVRILQQAILHVAPGHTGTTPPNLEHVRLGRELVTSLSLQVYQLASAAPTAKIARLDSNLQASVIGHIPLPLIVLDKSQNVLFANDVANNYLKTTRADMIGKNIYSIMDLSFPNEQTLEAWLTDCRANKVTAARSWDRVRLNLADQKEPLQFDMAAYYTKDDPSGAETVLMLFDQTLRYSQDDEAASYVALAVHELRTPLTILRGYIEVFEEELAGKLTPELNDFMNKMEASAEALAAFVNNILNVARVEDNQLTLSLRQETWGNIIKSVVDDMRLRAQVHGKTINYEVALGLPAVGVDKVSIYEVLNNLLDNAIKYSGQGQQIIVKSYLNQNGLVETTVQDFGVGIPEAVMPNLFDKFYRSHRSRAQIGGTGLGLYLSKAIVNAHGGQIWVQSKEGQGATFGFTVLPFDKLANELKHSDNQEITRGAHGWIKNHSLYRR